MEPPMPFKFPFQGILRQHEKATNARTHMMCLFVFLYKWESDGSGEDENLIICSHLKFLCVHDFSFLRVLKKKNIQGVAPERGRVSKYGAIHKT